MSLDMAHKHTDTRTLSLMNVFILFLKTGSCQFLQDLDIDDAVST